MISKEQYLQAKKTIADYELQEYLSGNSGLLEPDSGKTLTNVGGLWWETEPARGKTILEEAKERGFVNGAIVVTSYGTRYLLDTDPYMDESRRLIAKAFRMGTAIGSSVVIWNEVEGWLVRQEGMASKETKSPLQEAMDRGYRKGAVVQTCGVSGYLILTKDPWLADSGMVVCMAQPDCTRFDTLITIWDKEYHSVLVIKAPENKQL